MKKYIKYACIVIIFVGLIVLANIVKHYYFPNKDEYVKTQETNQVSDLISKKLDIRTTENGKEIVEFYETFNVYKLASGLTIIVNFNVNDMKQEEFNKILLEVSDEIEKTGITVNAITFYGFSTKNEKIIEVTMTTTGIHNLAINKNVKNKDISNYCMHYDYNI